MLDRSKHFLLLEAARRELRLQEEDIHRNYRRDKIKGTDLELESIFLDLWNDVGLYEDFADVVEAELAAMLGVPISEIHEGDWEDLGGEAEKTVLDEAFELFKRYYRREQGR